MTMNLYDPTGGHDARIYADQCRHERLMAHIEDESHSDMTTRAEIPLKQFLHEEAKRHNVAPNTIYYRIERGHYPQLKLRRVNKRLVFVSGSNVSAFAPPACATCKERLKAEVAHILGLLDRKEAK